VPARERRARNAGAPRSRDDPRPAHPLAQVGLGWAIALSKLSQSTPAATTPSVVPSTHGDMT
jgi:hypothetical protein